MDKFNWMERNHCYLLFIYFILHLNHFQNIVVKSMRQECGQPPPPHHTHSHKNNNTTTQKVPRYGTRYLPVPVPIRVPQQQRNQPAVPSPMVGAAGGLNVSSSPPLHIHSFILLLSSSSSIFFQSTTTMLGKMCNFD